MDNNITNTKLRLKIIFILMILATLISSIYYQDQKIKKSSSLVITLGQDHAKIDCMEVYFNNIYNKSWTDCKGENNKYYFKNIPDDVKNIRIDFGGSPNISFKVKEITFLSFKSKKSIDISSLAAWNKDQLTLNGDEYITDGNDSKILGDFRFESGNDKKDLAIFLLPILLLIAVFIYQSYQYGITYKLSEELLIILGFFLGIISSFPGHTNFDELYTLGEYFRGEVSDMHPPMQMLLSAHTIEIGLKFGLIPIISVAIILFIQLLIYWWSIKTLSTFIQNQFLRIVFLAILALSPIGLVYSAHIGKDSQMAIALLFSFTLILLANSKNKIKLLFIAIVPIFYAYTIRANGPAAVIPILFFWSISIVKILNFKKNIILKATGGFFLILLLINILNYSILRTNVKIHCCGGIQLIMTPVYDLMGVSKIIQKNLIPNYLYIDKYDLSDINKNFDSTCINWDGLKQADYSKLIPILQLWLDMIKDYPTEFIVHRFNTLKYFFGMQFSPPAFPYMSGFYNNIEKTGKSKVTNELVAEYNLIAPYLILKDILESYFGATAKFPFYRYWVYLLLNLVVFLYISKIKLKVHFPINILTFSALLYTLPYLILANSAQFRYIYWPVIAFYIVFFINLDQILLCKKCKLEDK